MIDPGKKERRGRTRRRRMGTTHKGTPGQVKLPEDNENKRDRPTKRRGNPLLRPPFFLGRGTMRTEKTPERGGQQFQEATPF